MNRISLKLLLVIVMALLIGTTALLAFRSGRIEARDQRRLLDVAAVQKALDVFFTENAYYPYNQQQSPSGILDYLDFWPQAPQPDGSCSEVQNKYAYVQKSAGQDYSFSFCLGRSQSDFPAGPHILTPKGIQ